MSAANDEYIAHSTAALERLTRSHADVPVAELVKTEEAEEAYRNGACWYLAWWLGRLSGLPVQVIGGYDGETLDALAAEGADLGPWDGFFWTHAGILLPDREEFLDICGLTDPNDAMDNHLDDEGEEHGMYPVPLADFTSVVVEHPDRVTGPAADLTRAVAEHLLTAHGVPVLPQPTDH